MVKNGKIQKNPAKLVKITCFLIFMNKLKLSPEILKLFVPFHNTFFVPFSKKKKAQCLQVLRRSYQVNCIFAGSRWWLK